MIRRMNLFRRLFALGDPRWGGQSGSDQDRQQPSSQPGSQEPTRGASGQEPDREPRDQRPEPPRSGGQKNNEPPDLDEVWRDFNRRLSGMFGGKSGNRGAGGGNGGGFGGGGRRGGSGGGFKAPNVRTGPAFGVVALGGVLLWMATGFYIVQEGQSSIILRFGEFRTTTSAGFNWRLPYPFESHEIVNLSQIRQVSVGVRGGGAGNRGRDSLMLPKDENMVDLQFAVQYRVGDAKDYLFNNVATDEIVAQAAETVMREIVGRSMSDTVLYENKEGIAREALGAIQAIADRYGSGLSIVDVTIQNAQPPEEVQAAFSDAIKAGQDAERLKSEGQAYANDVIPRARGSAERLIQEAEAYKERAIATAQGDAERFRKIVVEYNKAPAVTRERMYLEAMQQVFTNVSKVMVDSKSNSNLLYLPLDKLLSQTAAGAPGTPGASGASSTTGSMTTPQQAPAAPAAEAPPAAADSRGNAVPSLRDRLREAR